MVSTTATFFAVAAAAVGALTIPQPSPRSLAVEPPRYTAFGDAVQIAARDGQQLKVRIDNKLGKEVSVYIQGKVDNNYVMVTLDESGASTFTPVPAQPAPQGAISASGVAPEGKVGVVTRDGNSTSSAPQDLRISIPPEGKDFLIPGYMESSRIYISEEPTLQFLAQEPADPNGAPGIVQPDFLNPSIPGANTSWGFMEFNYSPSELFVNLSFVDFLGLVLGMEMAYNGDGGQTSDSVGGPTKDALRNVCDNLDNLSDQPDGMDWSVLCQRDNTGKPLRVISPEKYMSNLAGADSPFTTYFDGYVDRVWQEYAERELIVNTQDDGNGHETADGFKVHCKVDKDSDQLVCLGGDNQPVANFTRPTSRDIFGCAGEGPFAITGADSLVKKEIVPRLCAGFTRSTLLLGEGSDPQQHTDQVGKVSYYQEPITNHYARLVHDQLRNGRGYAFAYDDVNLDPTDANENTAGVIEQANPVQLTITVGGFDA